MEASDDQSPPEATQVFSSDQTSPSFELLVKRNGSDYWLASELASALGYSTLKSLQTAISKAHGTLMALGLPTSEHLISLTNGDQKLTKFACYLVAMNADNKKPQVAVAQGYFAALASWVADQHRQAEQVRRVDDRRELSEIEKQLASTAKRAGVDNYAFFQNKGYLGMYNMSLKTLEKHKGKLKTDKGPLLDFMGSRELAAQNFRIQETKARIEQENIAGQKELEKAAYDVGRIVRDAMTKTVGVPPEDLPLERDVKQVRQELKRTSRQIKASEKRKGKPNSGMPPA